MSGWMKRAAVAAALVVVASGCGGSSASDAVDGGPDSIPPTEVPTVASPAPTTTPADDPTEVAREESAEVPVAEPTATTEPEPTPTEVPVETLSTERQGEFACSNQESFEIESDPELDVALAELTGPEVPGLVAATTSSQGLVSIGAAGVRTVGGDDALLVSDRMHLGSDTKSMTGALLAILAEQNDFGLDTLVTDVWPNADGGWDGVTLHDLLRHRGGVEDSLGRDQGALWQDLWNQSIAAHGGTPAQKAAAAVEARAALSTALTSAAPSESVGDFAYSNSGYIMVGAALEAQLGTPWEELMCEHLFKPLRMDGCGFGGPPAPGAQGHALQASGLSPTGYGRVASDNPYGLGPAGTVHCPLSDWSRYLAWVLRGARGEDDLLPAESWELLLEPDGDYAGGWLVTTRGWSPGPIFTHNGSNTMWIATAWVAPEIDRAFFAVANAATPAARSAADQAIGLLIESN